MADCWYVLRTKPRADHFAALVLRREDCEFYFPRVRSSEASSEVCPLFPGYIFVKMDPEGTRWPAIARLPGISGWLRFDTEVPSISDEAVSSLTKMVNSINEHGGLWTRFHKGEEVRVVSGPIDLLARVVVEPVSPGDRVRVLMDFLGNKVPTDVPCSNLRPVSRNWSTSNIHKRERRTRGKGRWIHDAVSRISISV